MNPNNIQTIIDKFDERYKVDKKIPGIAGNIIDQAIKEFINDNRQFLKDSLTSMLDGIEKELPEEKENPNYDEAVRTNSLYAFNCYGWNSFREKVINIINSHR